MNDPWEQNENSMGEFQILNFMHGEDFSCLGYGEGGDAVSVHADQAVHAVSLLMHNTKIQCLAN